MKDPAPPVRPLRIFCIEDNPLIVLHLQMLIEEAGHVFVGSSESFAGLMSRIDQLSLDLALIDIDLADGRTGGEIAAWLHARGCPSLFVTGQEQIAASYAQVSMGVIAKPVAADVLAGKLATVRPLDRSS